MDQVTAVATGDMEEEWEVAMEAMEGMEEATAWEAWEACMEAAWAWGWAWEWA